MKRKILQKIADIIIIRLEKATEDDIFNFHYVLGIWLDNFCVVHMDIYLD